MVEIRLTRCFQIWLSFFLLILQGFWFGISAYICLASRIGFCRFIQLVDAESKDLQRFKHQHRNLKFYQKHALPLVCSTLSLFHQYTCEIACNQGMETSSFSMLPGELHKIGNKETLSWTYFLNKEISESLRVVSETSALFIVYDSKYIYLDCNLPTRCSLK